MEVQQKGYDFGEGIGVALVLSFGFRFASGYKALGFGVPSWYVIVHGAFLEG